MRSKAVYLALGVLPDGSRDILGIWIENTEGAKFWMKVFNDLKTRGVHDILIAVTDGLKGNLWTSAHHDRSDSGCASDQCDDRRGSNGDRGWRSPAVAVQ